MLSQLTAWDATAMSALHELRWAPLTALFVVASAWWVKWPLLAAVGAFGDTRAGWRVPRAAIATSLAAGLGALAATGIKEIVDRARPPLTNTDLTALVAVPGSSSFPSGHAATAFAAATAVAVLHPRLRVPALAIATLVARRGRREPARRRNRTRNCVPREDGAPARPSGCGVVGCLDQRA
jgi:membrane-associated phospholipid phosphatase